MSPGLGVFSFSLMRILAVRKCEGSKVLEVLFTPVVGP